MQISACKDLKRNGQTCKDLKRNGQNPGSSLKAAYVLVYAHNAFTGAGSLRVRTLSAMAKRVRTLSAMAKTRLSRLRPLMFWFMPITRSPAQKPAHKDLGRNGQNRAITTKATYAPVSNRA
ncbi:hypothetical protein HMPREF0541_01851, partial [Lacticaseibacillus rhamnosus ATCC 21052]